MKYKYIHMEEYANPGSTKKAFRVINTKSNDALGVIEWYSRWRQYCFIPYECTIFSADCLADIQHFINNIT